MFSSHSDFSPCPAHPPALPSPRPPYPPTLSLYRAATGCVYASLSLGRSSLISSADAPPSFDCLRALFYGLPLRSSAQRLLLDRTFRIQFSPPTRQCHLRFTSVWYLRLGAGFPVKVSRFSRIPVAVQRTRCEAIYARGAMSH